MINTNISERLYDLVNKNKILYVRTDSELNDFTKLSESFLIISGQHDDLQIRLNSDLKMLSCLLQNSLFRDCNIVCWNIKNIFTYLKFHVPDQYVLNPNCQIFDLKTLESLNKIKDRQPSTLKDAVCRLRKIIANDDWKIIYKNVHLPLSLFVLPDMESVGVIDRKQHKRLYSSYEIEGQDSGRLNCHKQGPNFFLPLNLNKEERCNLVPVGIERVFLYFDFQNMEVSTLQWLSQDEELGRFLASNKDFYTGLYELISRKESNENGRILMKNFFLPLVYGAGVPTISKYTKISEDKVSQIVVFIKNKFNKAFSWLNEQQNKLADNPRISDCFGRNAIFNKQQYKVRNFIVHSPAATICQHKLVLLHNAMGRDEQLVMNIHDAYILSCKKNDAKELLEVVKLKLEEESDLYPGLNLKVNGQIHFC